MISSIALIVSCRQPFIVASVNLKDDPPSCLLSRGEAHPFKLWTVKVLTFKAFN